LTFALLGCAMANVAVAHLTHSSPATTAGPYDVGAAVTVANESGLDVVATSLIVAALAFSAILATAVGWWLWTYVLSH
jgi:hypothetical protein